MLFLRVTEVQTVFSSLQATNVQNGLITVYEKSITPPLDTADTKKCADISDTYTGMGPFLLLTLKQASPAKRTVSTSVLLRVGDEN